MKLNEYTQNVPLRITAIQIVAFVLLAGLGGRLDYLPNVQGEYWAERAENQRVRFIPIPAQRGAILDRNSMILVDSRPTYTAVMSNEPLKKLSKTDLSERIPEYSKGLSLEPDIVIERLNLI